MVCLINRSSSSHRYLSMIQNPHRQGLRQMSWCSLVRWFPILGSSQGSHLTQAKIGRPWLSFPVHQSHETKPTLQPPQIHRLMHTFNISLETLQCLVLYLCPPSGWISVQVLCASENLSFQYSIFTFTPFSFCPFPSHPELCCL